MKNFLLFFLIPIVIFGQGRELLRGELIINLINYGSSWNVTIKLTAVGLQWDENYELTDEYNSASVSLSTSTQAQFDFVFEDQDDPLFALGLYKISAVENDVEQAYFYMSWRTSHLPHQNGDPDVYFKYDVENNRFRDNNDSETLDRTLQTIWDLRNNVDLITTGLEDYWQNCLALIPSPDNHPRLVWGPYPEQVDIAGYNIYRKVGSGGYSLIHTNSDVEFEYTDEDYYIIIPGSVTLYYYVKAIYTTEQLSPSTNIVTTRSAQIQKESIDEKLSKPEEFKLSQNYPNPFNPSTKIRYSVPEMGFVTLKVYDVVGSEVATLVNEEKPAGSYEIDFDSSDLTSGIYFYRLQANDFTQIRKMILLK